jgi:hypothetical protein
MNLLIGSRALSYWTGMNLKETTDWDVISPEPIDGVEFHDPLFLNNQEMLRFASDAVVKFNGNIFNVCNMKGLAIIKRSHLHRSLGFQKHITHYHKHGLFEHFNTLTVEEFKVYENRRDLTYKHLPQGYPKLNVKVEDFFDDYVTKKYNHDYLHELFAFYDKPLYTKLQKDNTLAWCDKDLWYNLSDEDKVKCVAEEVMVICTERFLVPQDWKYSSKMGHMKALDKVCTTLCSGWFRDFAIDNYPKVLALFDPEKYKQVQSILLKGELNA